MCFMELERKIFTIITAWNDVEKTSACIASVYAQESIKCKIILVDNGSKEHIAEKIALQYPDILIIRLGQNIGPTAGYCVGLNKALELGADFIFLLNNDTEIDHRCLEHLIREFESNLDVGLVFPLMYYMKEKNKIWSAGFRSTFLPFVETQIFSEMDDNPELWRDTTIELSSGPFCGVMFSRKTLLEVGLPDTRFIAYFEDADYCHRVRKYGHKILLQPKAKLWHHVSNSSGGAYNPFERYWMGRSSVLYFFKIMPIWAFPVLVIFRTYSAIRVTLNLIWKSKLNSIIPYWLGLFHGWAEVLFNRKWVARKYKIS